MWKTRFRAYLALVGLLVSGAGLAGAQDADLHLRYEVAGTPAHELMVRLTYPDGRHETVLSDAAGMVPLSGAPDWIEVTDPRSGLLLATLEGAAAGPEIDVPRVARLSADLEGFADALNITVDVGSGPPQGFRAFLTDEYYGDGGYTVRSPTLAQTENLPAMPRDWDVYEVHGNARFVSDAFVLDRSGAVAVVVHSAAGEVVLRNVTISATYAIGTVHHLGALRPDVFPGLRLDLADDAAELTGTRLTVQLERDAPLDAAEWRQAALLFRVNRDHGLFAAGLAPLVLPQDGPFVLPALPEIGPVTAVIESQPSGVLVRLPVDLSGGGVAALTLARAALLGLDKPVVAATGRIVDGNGRPVAGMQATLISVPLRQTVVTDADGRFRVEGLREGRPVQLILRPEDDEPRAGGFARTFEPAEIQSAATGETVLPDFVIPATDLPAKDPVPAPGVHFQYVDCSKKENWLTSLQYVYVPDPNNWRITVNETILFATASKEPAFLQSPINLEYYFNVTNVELRYARSVVTLNPRYNYFFGDRTSKIVGHLGVQYTPFIVGITSPQVFYEPLIWPDPDQFYSVHASFNPADPQQLRKMNEQVAFELYYDNGFAKTLAPGGTEVLFPPLATGAEPYPGLTAANGQLVFEAAYWNGNERTIGHVQCLNTIYLDYAEMPVFADFTVQGQRYMMADSCRVFAFGDAPARLLVRLIAEPYNANLGKQGRCEYDTNPPANRFHAIGPGDGP